MKSFEYVAPEKLEEAVNLLVQHDGKAAILAGGTDLLVKMRDRVLLPGLLIDLKHITDLSGIDYSEAEGLRIGALVNICDIEKSRLIQEKFSMLSQAAGTLGSVQVRNKATVGGNLCNAAPSADMAPSLLGLGASVTLTGPSGESLLPLEEFFTGPGETVLGKGQILKDVRVPNMSAHSAGIYLKFSRRKAMDLALVGVASVLTMGSALAGCTDIRIVLGAVASTPLRAKRAEAVLRGNKISDFLIKEAAKVASEEAAPITDVRASLWYRKQIIEVLVNQSIVQAREKLKSGGNEGEA